MDIDKLIAQYNEYSLEDLYIERFVLHQRMLNMVLYSQEQIDDTITKLQVVESYIENFDDVHAVH